MFRFNNEFHRACKRILIRNRVASSSKITSGERYIFFGPAGRYNYKFVSTFDKLLFLKYATKMYRYKEELGPFSSEKKKNKQIARFPTLQPARSIHVASRHKNIALHLAAVRLYHAASLSTVPIQSLRHSVPRNSRIGVSFAIKKTVPHCTPILHARFAPLLASQNSISNNLDRSII